MFTVNIIFCPLKQTPGDLKTVALKMSQLTQCKLQRCQTRRSDMELTAEIMQTYDLQTFAIAQSNSSTLLKFLLITQLKLPSINTSEAKKRSSDRERQNVKMSRTVEVVD